MSVSVGYFRSAANDHRRCSPFDQPNVQCFLSQVRFPPRNFWTVVATFMLVARLSMSPFFPLSRFLCCPPFYVTPVEATVSCYSFGVVTRPISTAPVLMLTIIVIVGTSLPTPSTSSTATQKTQPPSTSTTQPPNHGPPKQPRPRPPLRVDPNSTQLTLVGSSIMIPMSFVRLFPSPSLECYCNNVG